MAPAFALSGQTGPTRKTLGKYKWRCIQFRACGNADSRCDNFGRKVQNGTTTNKKKFIEVCKHQAVVCVDCNKRGTILIREISEGGLILTRDNDYKRNEKGFRHCIIKKHFSTWLPCHSLAQCGSAYNSRSQKM